LVIPQVSATDFITVDPLEFASVSNASKIVESIDELLG
jgi:hypothetical protein